MFAQRGDAQHGDVVGLSSGESHDSTRTLTAAEWESWYSAEAEEHIYQLVREAEAAPVDHDLHVLPDDLESIAPGVLLGAVLSSVDRSKLSGWDVVRLMRARHRQLSHSTALFYADVNEVAHAYDPDGAARLDHPADFASEELQAALRMTRRAADRELGYATDLTCRLPQVWEALEQGRIDPHRARIFSDETITLQTQHLSRIFENDLIDQAADLTTGQLRVRLKDQVIGVDPDSAAENLQRGIEDRRLVTYPNPDHTGTLAIQGANPLQVLAASNHVRSLAKQLKALPGETRISDQITADIALDLLQGKTIQINPDTTTTVTPPRIVVQVQPGAPTFHAPGYGPILTLQSTSVLNGFEGEVETLRDTGQVEDNCSHQTDSRRPTTTQAEHVRRVYPTCVFPGCRMPATKCDLDHRTPWHQGGKTTCTNLAPLCRHHHICKHQANWKLERLPDGSHQWTSPLGHVYTRGPP